MLTYLFDWAGLLVRWLHVVAGIAWIGASFYFVWLDNHLQPVPGSERVDPNVAGELWAVHGGGFYRSQKYRLAPEVLPPKLHWFYWEAYTTWLSGFALLTLLYFVRAEAYLIDPSVVPLTKTAAITIALGVLIASWLVYDGLCRSVSGAAPGRWPPRSPRSWCSMPGCCATSSAVAAPSCCSAAHSAPSWWRTCCS
jgi:uncharacterized membrane protein